MICINLGVRTQEEKSREESRDDTPQFTKRRIINKEDQEGVQAKTRWCRRNFSEKGTMKNSLGKKFSCKITHETTLFFRETMVTDDGRSRNC